MEIQCFLHIGVYKTGTTAIQRCLELNSEHFRKKGVAAGSRLCNGHGALSRYLSNENYIGPSRIRNGIKTSADIQAYGEKIKKYIDIQKKEGMKTFVFSDESLCAYSATADLERIKCFFEEYFNSIQIVIYVRNQIELASSNYNQYLRSGGTRSQILPDDNEMPKLLKSYFDFNKLLSRWSDLFGREKIIPRVFEKENLAQNDVCIDFLRLISLYDENIKLPGRINEGYSIKAQEFLRRVNMFGFVDILGEELELHRRFRRSMNRNDHFKGDGRLPSREEAIKFYGFFRDSNEKVKASWFPGNSTLFKIDFDKYNDSTQCIDLKDSDSYNYFIELLRSF
jgi:hypothetical protein